jgi:hypothetical protein
MTFTYVAPTTDRDKIRFLIGDTVSADANFQDEELTYLISTWGNVFDAAISAAEILAGRFARRSNYSRSVGDLSISESLGSSAVEFRSLAISLRNQRDRLAPPTPRINAQSIKNTGDKLQETYNSDFYTGLHDNVI